jgi:cyclopropane fatty-acyl-phospholipid synthase-like methyltransferase
MEYIIKKAGIFKNAKVLGLGCGSGYLVNNLSKYCDALGISNSIECVRQAKKNFPDADFQLGNMENFRSREPLTHCLSLESSGYADIEKTLKNTYSNLRTGGVFYLKDLFLKKDESKEEKENRIHWENYWKFKLVPMERISDLAQRTGFEVLESNDLTGKVNGNLFSETLKLNLVKYTPLNPHMDFIRYGEFLFVKK